MDALQLTWMLKATASTYTTPSTQLLFESGPGSWAPSKSRADPALEAYCASLLIAPSAPSTTAEDFVFEFLKTARDDDGFTTMSFKKEDICAGFVMIMEFLGLGGRFREEIEEVVGFCPLKEGGGVERKVFVEWIVEAARQLGVDWAQDHEENPVKGREERANVLFGVIFACVVQRKRKEEEEREINNALDDFMAGFRITA